MKNYIRIQVFLIVGLLLAAVSSLRAEAQEYSSDKNGLDVIFVMDYSGSMTSNDPEHTAQAMVKAFIDTVHSADIRIGFVSYNDRILSSTSPVTVSTAEERELLKRLMDSAGYSGNTDIGLGLRYAYELAEPETNRKQTIVLISDGETDLNGSQTGRTRENSALDVTYAVEACKEKGIPVYTIAFGRYDGKTDTLTGLAEATGAAMYSVQSPADLIDILYGIFTTNMDYSIQEIANSVYAQGMQNIRVKLDEAYLDELDVLMISPQPIGPVGVLYGGRQIQPVNLRNYVVGKITEVDDSVKELTVQTSTSVDQELKLYLISYRDLIPVLKVEPSAGKNQPLRYEIYFKDKNGTVITDDGYYDNFTSELSLTEGMPGRPGERLEATVGDGVISGSITLGKSGTYYLEGRLEDSMGTCRFEPVKIEVVNRRPSGGLPEHVRHTAVSGGKTYDLNEYFSDPDGDGLTYTIEDHGGESVKADLVDGILSIHPQKSGRQTLVLGISDGEESISYSYHLTVIPLWKAYWWALLLIGILSAAILWKVCHKPKPELEQIAERKAGNRFAGKLDAYVTVQPEETEEIPPLTFPMYKIRDSRISIGDLMREYPDLADQLGLDQIFLIADEERKMILYHSTSSTVMIGGSIACRQLQYSVSFGDILYIAAQDGAYELEIHYIAVI